MKKIFVVTAVVEIEVFANNENEATSLAHDAIGNEVTYFNPKSVVCYEDEE